MDNNSSSANRNNSGVQIEHYKKRQGCVSDGDEFEYATIANWALKLVLKSDIKNFNIKSNVSGYGSFDDVVLKWEDNIGDKNEFAIQLKYTSNPDKVLSKESLNAETGNFALQKYFKDYELIKGPNVSYILFAKINFNLETEEQMNNGIISYRIRKTKNHLLLSYLNNSCSCYQFEADKAVNNTDDATLQKYKEFFKNFFFYTTSTTTNEKLKREIKEIFQLKFDAPKVSTNYLKFIENWYRDNYSLTKTVTRLCITLCLLDVNIQEFTFDEEELTEKKALLLETVLTFTATHINEHSCKVFKNMGNDIKQNINEDVLKTHSKHYQLYEETSSNLKYTKILWLENKCPLIVSDTATTRKAIQLSPDKKYVLIGKEASKIDNVDNFIKLADVEQHSTLYYRILKNYNCTLQNQVINLETLIKVNKNIAKVISANEVCSMAENTLNCAEIKTELPQPHISPRHLSKIMVDESIFNIINNDTTIFIACNNSTYLKDYSAKYALQKNVKIKKKFSSQEIRTCENHYYSFRVNDNDGNIEFCGKRSNNNEITVENYVRKIEYSEDTIILQNEADVNIVCDNSGSGKSTFLKHLLYISKPTLWSALINARSLSEHFSTNGDDLEQFKVYLLEDQGKVLNSFEFSVFKLYLEKNAIRFLWDGIDELDEKQMEIINSIIKQLLNNTTKHWLTARTYLKNQLEDEFQVCSKTLKIFDERQQKEFLKRSLSISKDQTQETYDNIKNVLLMNNNILGIPLQMSMLVKLLKRNKTQNSPIEYQQLTLDRLYQSFVDGQFEVYYQEKLEMDLTKPHLLKMSKNDKKERQDFYQNLSVRLYFPEHHLTKLNIRIKNDLFQEVQTSGDKAGFIVKFNDKLPQFFHNSVSEYFAALLLSENLEKIKHFKYIIFKERYTNIRFFFDLILAQESKAHVAVLYKNWSLLERCGKEGIEKLDKGGRNVLQILSSWGLRLNEMKKIKYSFFFPHVNILLPIKRNAATIAQHLELLADQLPLSWKDRLFDLDSFSYASKSENFLALGVLSTKCATNQKFLKYKVIVVYYCMLLDYSNILNILKEIPVFQIMDFCFYESLLTWNNCINWIKKILLCDKFKISFNLAAVGRGGNQPLHFLCLRSLNNLHLKENEEIKYEIAEMLINAGANINAPNIKNETPLFLAIGSGLTKLVRLLIKCRAIINTLNVNRMTPLHIACISNNFEIVKTLLENKADATVTDNQQKQPIHYAQQEAIREIILLYQLKFKKTFKTLRYPLHRACQKGDYNEVKKYLRTKKSDIDTTDDCGVRPIEYAYNEENQNIIKLLIDKGANYKFTNCFKRNFLHRCCVDGKNDLLLFFLKYDLDVNAKDCQKLSPLHLSLESSNMIQLFLDKKVNVNVSDIFERTPLHWFSTQPTNSLQTLILNNTKFIPESELIQSSKLLVEHNANVNYPDCLGRTPLLAACLIPLNHKKIQFLLENAAADPNISDYQKKTPLHYSCKNSDIYEVQLLLNNRANVNLISYNGKSPLHHACKKGNMLIVQLLLEKGANVNIFDIYNMRPINYASECGFEKIVNYLNQLMN